MKKEDIENEWKKLLINFLSGSFIHSWIYLWRVACLITETSSKNFKSPTLYTFFLKNLCAKITYGKLEVAQDYGFGWMRTLFVLKSISNYHEKSEAQPSSYKGDNCIKKEREGP